MNKKWLLFALVSILFLHGSYAYSLTLNNGTGIFDSYLSETSPESDFSALPYLILSSYPKNDIYFVFNLSSIPYGYELRNAELCLYSFANFNKAEVNVLEAKNSFGLNFNPGAMPCFSNECEKTSSFNITKTGQYCFAITNPAKNSYYSSKNFGIVLSTQSDSTAFFWASEGQITPYLKVEYFNDTTPPKIYSENSSLNESYIGSRVLFQAGVEEYFIREVWFEIGNEKINASLENGVYSAEFSNFSDKGEVRWRVCAEDFSGNSDCSDFHSIIILNRAPDKPLTIIFPDKYSNGEISLSFSSNDLDNDSLKYSVYYKSKSDTDYKLLNQISRQNYSFILDEGDYSFYVVSNDGLVDSEKSEENEIIIDKTRPELKLEGLRENYCTNKVPLNYFASDNVGVKSCFYELNSEINEIENCKNLILQAREGENSLNLEVVDYAGNSKRESFEFNYLPSESCSSILIYDFPEEIKAHFSEIFEKRLKAVNTGSELLENCSFVSKSGLNILGTGIDFSSFEEKNITLKIKFSNDSEFSNDQFYLRCDNFNSEPYSSRIVMAEKSFDISISNIERFSGGFDVSYNVKNIGSLDRIINISLSVEDDNGNVFFASHDEKFAPVEGEINETIRIPVESREGLNLVIKIEYEGETEAYTESLLFLNSGFLSGFAIFGKDINSGGLAVVIIILFIGGFFIVRGIARFVKNRQVERGGIIKVKSSFK